MSVEIAPEELLIATVAGMLEGLRHVAVGAQSPIPGSAALLARAKSGESLRVSMLGSEAHSPFTDGGRELFDCAAQGRIDAFFLGGGQIDAQANINLVGIGDYPNTKVRFPGSFGSAYLYLLVPRVILFRKEHTARVLVPKVDFISAPGVSDENVHRTGAPGNAAQRRAGLQTECLLPRAPESNGVRMTPSPQELRVPILEAGPPTGVVGGGRGRPGGRATAGRAGG